MPRAIVAQPSERKPLQVSDRIVIVGADGLLYEFRVTELDGGFITAKQRAGAGLFGRYFRVAAEGTDWARVDDPTAVAALRAVASLRS